MLAFILLQLKKMNQKDFNICAFYSDDLKEFDRYVNSHLELINSYLNLNNKLKYERKKEYVVIYNSLYSHAFFTSVELQAWLSGVNFGATFK